MNKITLHIDVSGFCTFSDRQFIHAWLLLPDNANENGIKSLVICLPGGTYSKIYYHFSGIDVDNYSMAEFFTKKGHALLSIDHLGVGESTKPEEAHLLSRDVLSDVYHQVVITILDMFAKGDISPDLQPLTGLSVTGIGHSMGGMILVTQQGRYHTYERIAVLGWVNEVSAVPSVSELLLPPNEAPSYIDPNRKDTRSFFYMDDVPENIINLDTKAATNIPVTLLREVLTPGIALNEAKKIVESVFIGFGERDMTLNPHIEPSSYPLSNDVSLYILKKSGHCHNFASTREKLWERLCSWISMDIHASL